MELNSSVGQRNCPTCKKTITYKSFAQLKIAINKNTCCRECKNTQKETSCKTCKGIFTYKTFKPEVCKTCLKKRRLEEAGSKKCSTHGCNNIIVYKLKWDRLKGEATNSICPTCIGVINKKLRQGKTNYDLWIEKGFSEEEAKQLWEKSEAKRLEKRKTYKHSLDTRVKIGLKSKGRIVSKETRKKTSDRNKKLISEGKLCGINQVKRYTIDGLSCQGSYEKKYIEKLISNKLDLPSKPKGQLTPIGYYIPDFEYPDRFVEIKGVFSYDVFLLKIPSRYKSSCFQKEKVEWVGANIKPVQLLVLDADGSVLKEEWYTFDGIEVKIDLLGK